MTFALTINRLFNTQYYITVIVIIFSATRDLTLAPSHERRTDERMHAGTAVRDATNKRRTRRFPQQGLKEGGGIRFSTP